MYLGHEQHAGMELDVPRLLGVPMANGPRPGVPKGHFVPLG
jgi:hypothetical protein